MSHDPQWRDWPVVSELYRQWRSVRGAQLFASVRPFSRDWQKLLADADLRSAASQTEAARDVRILEGESLLRLKPARYNRERIERVIIPVEAEPRWRELFGDADAIALRDAALRIFDDFADHSHPLFAVQWREWCHDLSSRLRAGRHIRPLDWRDGEQLRTTLEILSGITGREWPGMTPVRAASVELGFPSKALEQQQTVLERLLTGLIGAETTFESIGLVGTPLLLMVSGPLRIDFAEDSRADFSALRGCYGISEGDLERATQISTTADQILTVENVKTTFHQIASASSDRRTLVIASSYATVAIQHLLRKITPNDIPHFHFGDTDAYGFQILHNLRKASPRPVHPFLMRYRPSFDSDPLDTKSRRVAETLLASETLADCRLELSAMLESAQKGDYEQETYGPPNRPYWPFFDAAFE